MNYTTVNRPVKVIRRDYAGHAITSLPFVAEEIVKRRRVLRYWSVPKIKDYTEAHMAGIQDACDFLQYISQSHIGASASLAPIVQHMFVESPQQRLDGRRAGFLMFLGNILMAGARTLDFYEFAESRLQDINDVLEHQKQTKSAKVAA